MENQGKTQKNRKNQERTQKNTEKQGESEENTEKHGKPGEPRKNIEKHKETEDWEGFTEPSKPSLEYHWSDNQ